MANYGRHGAGKCDLFLVLCEAECISKELKGEDCESSLYMVKYWYMYIVHVLIWPIVFVDRSTN